MNVEVGIALSLQHAEGIFNRCAASIQLRSIQLLQDARGSGVAWILFKATNSLHQTELALAEPWIQEEKKYTEDTDVSVRLGGQVA